MNRLLEDTILYKSVRDRYRARYRYRTVSRFPSSLFSPILLINFLCLVTTAFAQESGFRTVKDQTKLSLQSPTLSERKTSKIILDNGMQVYLISDPGADQSAAGVGVEAGSWNDPKEYPGMAHFLEHMLFMGNAAYPEEFAYMQYIHDHGGNVNASTWPDRTIYMFSINNDAFEGALDRFSHFFIDPLFNPSCINRELHAVDQEHAKNIENDGWRQYMVFKETGNQRHPNAGFSTGNAKTLSGIPQTALKKWYEEHYSANKMHLVLYSPLPLEELTRLAVSRFSSVPSREVVDTSLPTYISSPKQWGHMIYLKPIKDLRTLSLTWEVPANFSKDNEKKVPDLIAYILNKESANSLIQILKKERLAEGVKVSSDHFAKNKILFSIDVDLTPQGLTQVDSVLLRVFQTLAMLKEQGIPAYLFEEMKKMQVIDYQQQSREDAFDFISRHTHDLIDEELSTYPEKTSVIQSFDADYTRAFLDTLAPENCIYFLIADPEKSGITLDKKEKWMGAEYAMQTISEEKALAWERPALSPEISLPPANPFIPDSLELVSSHEEEKEEPNREAALQPTLLANDDLAKVYFAQDRQYLVPEVSTLFGIRAPLIDGSSKSSALSDLYLRALKEKLSSTLAYARYAGLYTQFSLQNFRLNIHVNGYSPKASLLLEEIFSSLKSVAPTREQFEVYKTSLLSDYENGSKELPVRQANELLGSILYNDSPLSQEKAKALKAISYEDFLIFSKNLFKRAFIEGLFYGNLRQKETETLFAKLKSALGAMPYLPEHHLNKRVLLLSDKKGPRLVQENTPRQGNGVVLLLQEGGFSFERRAAQQILSKALQEAFFDTLRTKQQTAYMAKAWDLEIERQLFQFFAVQSSTHHPADLIARFELFLEDFVKYLPESLSKERFENIRQMLIVTLKMPPENLFAMAERLNRFAFEYNGDFNWMEKRIDAMNAISYERVFSLAREFLSRTNTRRLAILMEGVLPTENYFHYEEISRDELYDLGSYVSAK